MVDPVSIVVGALVTKVATKALDALADPELGFGAAVEPDDEILHAIVDDRTQETLAVVTEVHLREIETMLESDEVAQLVRTWCVLGLADSDGARHIVDHEIPTAFAQIAHSYTSKKMNKEDDWSSLAPILWKLLTSGVTRAIPRIRTIISNEAAARQLLGRVSTGSRMLRSVPPESTHMKTLAQILSSPKRMVDALDDVREICKSASAHYADLTLSHAHEEYRVAESKLYVERSLAMTESSLIEQTSPNPSVPTLTLTDASVIMRAIVVGDPGVGKSTLVKHILHGLGLDPSMRLAPVLIVAREYAANAWEKSVTDYIAATIQADYDLGIPTERVADILTLGNSCVIVDGVDEILDISIRRKFIARIETFARRFPSVTVICTSRKIGYRQAVFSPEFALYELSEFSEDQIVEYVDKWFNLEGWNPADKVAFLYEIETLSDIASNPLMLSLLCTLYRARGFIPRNRRHVYRNCAELLFQRWDSMRHIDQPYDHRQYGERLMQELARFYSQSSAAQSGVEEGQLEKLIAIFFQDTGSVDELDSVRRARQFLDFCAGRAWLLTKKGTNDRGLRLFGFTHRTFMEYLAAEAVVRIAPDVKEIARQVLHAFERDESSVMPDVMVQAAEDKFDRGAELVLSQLLNDGRHKAAIYGDKFLHLCLRIVNSSPMSKNVTGFLPRQILTYWSRIGDIEKTVESSTALFAMYRDPRTKLIKALSIDQPALSGMSIQEVAELRYEICRRWARFARSTQHEIFEHDWTGDLEAHFQDIAKRPEIYAKKKYLWNAIQPAELDPAIADYLLGRALISPSKIIFGKQVRPRLAIDGFSNSLVGSLVYAVEDVFFDGYGQPGIEGQGLTELREWIVEKGVTQKVGAREAAVASDILTRRVDLYWDRALRPDVDERLDLDLNCRSVVWICMLLWEAEDGLHDFHKFVAEFDAVPSFELFGGLRAANKYRRVNAVIPEFEDKCAARYEDMLRPWLRGRSVLTD